MHSILYLLNTAHYVLLIVSVESFVVNLHQCAGTKTKTMPIVSLHESVITDNNPLKVDRVTICMGELCKCQDENADMIMQSLVSKGDLPFQIEDSPCLGACGVGAMVSIEYEDGSYNLVTGLQETLKATGLSGRIVAMENSISQDMTSTSDPINQDDKISFNQMNSDDGNIVTIVPNLDGDSSDKVNGTFISAGDEDNMLAHEAVKRMRDEARESNEEVLNPWVNLALYLFNKTRSE
jgi:hypothetical protein